MSNHIILLSVPGLRDSDLEFMPNLQALMAAGDKVALRPSFPCVTWPVQANMLCGCLPAEHGVTANGFFWREKSEIEMWTAGNEVIERPQIWDRLHEASAPLTSAAWFPMLSKRCGADYVCMPAPVHNPDGSESLWCYTKPTELYGDLRDALGHFPLKHFWGPLANIQSSQWIADSAVVAAEKFRPNFFYIYLPHLDYAAQKTGPDSDLAMAAVGDLDQLIASLSAGMENAYGDRSLTWMAVSEYAIVPVDHVTYPNRVLREAGLLAVREQEDGEQLDLAASQAWALVDHQFSHIYVRDADARTTDLVKQIFTGTEGIAEVLAAEQRDKYQMQHPRSGEVILISSPNSWQAYYYWLDDTRAPAFARTVDIHRKPGYDPVELHFDPAAKGIPLDASLIRGSHGAPVGSDVASSLLICSESGLLPSAEVRDTDVAGLVLNHLVRSD